MNQEFQEIVNDPTLSKKERLDKMRDNLMERIPPLIELLDRKIARSQMPWWKRLWSAWQ